MNRRMEKVEDALEEARAIRSAFESLAHVQESATLAQFGIDISTDSESSLSSSEAELDNDAGQDVFVAQPAVFRNWYELMSVAEESGVDVSSLETEYVHILPHLSEQERLLLDQSLFLKQKGQMPQE